MRQPQIFLVAHGLLCAVTGAWATDDIRLEELGSSTTILLPDQIEGVRRELVLQFTNNTGANLDNLTISAPCKCVQPSIDAKSLADGETTKLTFIISPPKDRLAETIWIEGKVSRREGAGNEQAPSRLHSIRIGAKCYPPIRIDEPFILLDNKFEGSARLIRGSQDVRIPDPGQIHFSADELEVKSVSEADGAYTIQFGLRDGINSFDQGKAVFIRAPFVFGDNPKMQMEELMHIYPESAERIDVVPRVIRMTAEQDIYGSYKTYTGRVVLKEYTRSPGVAEVLMVAREGDSVLLIDPDIKGDYERRGENRIRYIGLSARIYDSVAPNDQVYIVIHQKNLPIDLSLAWEDFEEHYNVYETILLP